MDNPSGTVTGRIVHIHEQGETWEQRFSLTLDDNCCEEHARLSGQSLIRNLAEEILAEESKWGGYTNEVVFD